MAETVRAAVIGTGRKPEKPGLAGWAMAYYHAEGYDATDGVRIVACADIKEENAAAFAERFHVPSTYHDYNEMLRSEKPDVVSITTWPHLHAPMILDAIEAGVPAIHCEKPMATSFGDVKRIMDALATSESRLTFNHQRRMGGPLRAARDLVQSGAIGCVRRVEAYAQNLFDYGVNSIDVMSFIVGDLDVEWVLGAIDRRRLVEAFGVPTEYQGVANFMYAGGIHAALYGGGYEEGPDLEEDDPAYRVLGSEGIIELNWKRSGRPVLRYYNGEGVHEPNMGDETIHGPMQRYITRAIGEVVRGVRSGETTVLDAANEFRSMQVIFGAYESVRRQARVDFPLDIDDSPLLELLRSRG